MCCLSFPYLLGYPALWYGLNNTRTRSVGKLNQKLSFDEKNSSFFSSKYDVVFNNLLIMSIFYTVTASTLITCTLLVNTLLFRFKKYRLKKKNWNTANFVQWPLLKYVAREQKVCRGATQLEQLNNYCSAALSP